MICSGFAQPDHGDLKLNGDTIFSGAIIDDAAGFIDFIKGFTPLIPAKIKNKSILKMKLLERISDEPLVDQV